MFFVRAMQIHYKVHSPDLHRNRAIMEKVFCKPVILKGMDENPYIIEYLSMWYDSICLSNGIIESQNKTNHVCV